MWRCRQPLIPRNPAMFMLFAPSRSARFWSKFRIPILLKQVSWWQNVADTQRASCHGCADGAVPRGLCGLAGRVPVSPPSWRRCQRYILQTMTPMTLQSPAVPGAYGCGDGSVHGWSVECTTHRSPTSPRRSLCRISLFSAKTNKIMRSITRFSDTARSGTFRSDGRLLTAGCDDGVVKVFDIASKSVLRTLVGHKGYV